MKGSIGDIKAKLAFSAKAKNKFLRKHRKESTGSGQPGDAEDPTRDSLSRGKSAGDDSHKRSVFDTKSQTTGREGSPLPKKAWKSKSRNTSKKKSKRKRTRSNKISDQRKRKFSVSDDEKDMGATSNTSPFMKVPNNTVSKQFYSKNARPRKRTESKKERSPRKRHQKSRSNKKKPGNRLYSQKKKEGRRRESAETVQVLLDGSSDVSSEAVNLIIGDKDNGISQMYSNMGVDFGRKFAILLKSVKFGFDMDYITGIQAEYVVGSSSAIRAYSDGESTPEILKVEDPSKIKGGHVQLDTAMSLF